MRRIALALALIGTACSIADYLGWRASHTRLLALAETSGLSRLQPEVGEELRRKPAATRAATLLAWNLLDLEIDRAWLAELPADERRQEADRSLERLALAEELATGVLTRQPASWAAFTVLGGSRFLADGRQGRRDRPPSAWRQPLAAAMELAPNHADPPLLLAAAEMSRWANLSPAQRRELTPLLRRALDTPRGLDLLLPAWVRLAPLSQLVETMPDRAPEWQRLSEEFLRLGDLERFALARTGWRERLPELLAERLDSARARLDGGERASAEALLRSVLAAPPDPAMAESFAAALSLLPEKAVGGRQGAHLRGWLSWALDLCVLGRCPLDGATLRRLAGRIADLEPSDLALATLAGADPQTAAPLEPEADAGEDPRWNRYWIYKAGRLASHDHDAARAALARVVAQPSDELRLEAARVRLAEAAGDDGELDSARRSLARLARDRWPAEQWSSGRTAYRLEVLATDRLGGLEITAGPTGEGAAALEVRWDGRTLGVAVLQPGESRRWLLEVTPGLHLVEVANLAGRPLRPANLRLLPQPPAG